jgi:signal transduction histidine kinase
LNNAVKFSENGTVSITASVEKDMVTIAVSDTGIGIAKEDMDRLFHPFERIDSRLSIKAGGTGLGLYLTRKLVTEVLHGKIEVESEVGKGSVFRLKIPAEVRGEGRGTTDEKNKGVTRDEGRGTTNRRISNKEYRMSKELL